MYYYISYGVFQQQLKEHYEKTGQRYEFWEMMNLLYRRGMLSQKRPDCQIPRRPLGELSLEEVDRLIDSVTLMANTDSKDPSRVTESDIFPFATDVFIIRHPRYTRKLPHVHNYFEMDYVLNGSCTFYFNDTPKTFHTGDMCIISAGSRHAVVIDDDSMVFTIMLRKSTFTKTYLSLLNNNDLFSHFFYGSLSNRQNGNYLLLSCPPSQWLQNLLLQAMIECYDSDRYSNVCCVSMINELFVHIMRHCAQNVEMFNQHINSEFAPVLQYIQDHYQALTLSELAAHFHYSVPYLCTIIKQRTGKNFSEVVKELRLGDATGYLINTNMKVHEIAEKVGYNSTDHFSRTFRAQYHMSPQAYRKQFAEENDTFVPFQSQ